MSVIFALSSAGGRAAVAVIRLSGAGALEAAARIAGDLPPARRLGLRRLRRLNGDVLDEALVVSFPGAASATGEDLAEFHVHGSRAVVAALLEDLGALPGCRMAEAGEFSRRAFRNGKRDLAALEGLADLIEAETEGQRRQALRQMQGRLGDEVVGWRASLLDVQAELEAELDFSDEGDVATDLAGVRARLGRLVAALDGALEGTSAAERVREGFRVVIAGPPNAGKSTLLNALAGRDVAIVTATPGTTRDVLDVELDIGGRRVILSDTAGLRDAGDDIEAEGIRRARLRIEDADLVLWLDELNPVPDAPPGALPVRTKVDRFGADPSADGIVISCVTGLGLEALLADVGERAALSLDAGVDALVVRRRHRDAIREARVDLGRGLSVQMPELIAESCRRARLALGRIVGADDPEAVLGVVFGRFCIGK
ncbi:MAG: tRNA uridine-5-carboxymethylaminomethyl(34) synthesis GTPase MnmE [Rhizobiales bacterium]|nr:tRNA uridine-5-carboxymethylaminomethyl(34) synthesis GTPase MnmE [Hyphomicrobiales bacterium]